MKLWLVRRADRPGYDEYDAIVVAAETQMAAWYFVVYGPLNPTGLDGYECNGLAGKWADPEEIGLSLKVADSPFVVLASFQAG